MQEARYPARTHLSRSPRVEPVSVERPPRPVQPPNGRDPARREDAAGRRGPSRNGLGMISRRRTAAGAAAYASIGAASRRAAAPGRRVSASSGGGASDAAGPRRASRGAAPARARGCGPGSGRPGRPPCARPELAQQPVALRSLSAPSASTSKTASIRDAVTFACWPPGPEERLALSSISSSGIGAHL